MQGKRHGRWPGVIGHRWQPTFCVRWKRHEEGWGGLLRAPVGGVELRGALKRTVRFSTVITNFFNQVSNETQRVPARLLLARQQNALIRTPLQRFLLSHVHDTHLNVAYLDGVHVLII